MTGPERTGRLLLVVATTVGATFTLLVAGGSGSLEAQPVRITYIAMAAVALITWLVWASARPTWRPSTRLTPAIVAILGAFTVSTITSRNPRLSLEMLAYVFLLLLVYLLLVALMRRSDVRAHVERLALLFCLAVAGLYVLQVVAAWIEWWGLVGRVGVPPLRPGYAGLTLGSPNPVASLVLLLGAFAMATTAAGRRLPVAALLVGATIVAVFMSGSRGAWLGLVTGGAITVAAVALRPGVGSAAGRFVRSRAALAVAIVAVPLGAVAAGFAGVTGRLTLDDGGYRASFTRASLTMIESSPLTGVGPGLWGPMRAGSTLSTDVDLYIPHAHNVYVQTVAELGLIGLVSGLFVIGSVGWLILRALRSAEGTRWTVALAALFGVALLMVQQIADVLVNVPAVLLAAALPIAWLDATDPVRPPDTTSHSRRAARLESLPFVMGLGFTSILALVALARIESVAGDAARAAASANGGRWEEAARLSASVVASDPEVAFYQFLAGVSAANAGEFVNAERFLSASSMADDLTYGWANLAAVRWRLGDTEGARAALSRAERQGWQRASVALAAGWLREQLGDRRQATADYATALAREPTLVMDPFWSSPDGPPGGIGPILDALVIRASPDVQMHIDLLLGRFERAEKRALSYRGSDSDLYGVIVPAWRGDPESWLNLQHVAVARPLDRVTVTWALNVAVHRDDLSAIQRFSLLQATISTRAQIRPSVARIVVGEPLSQPPSTLDRYASVYRRLPLDAQLIGLLPQVSWHFRAHDAPP